MVFVRETHNGDGRYGLADEHDSDCKGNRAPEVGPAQTNESEARPRRDCAPEIEIWPSATWSEPGLTLQVTVQGQAVGKERGSQCWAGERGSAPMLGPTSRSAAPSPRPLKCMAITLLDAQQPKANRLAKTASWRLGLLYVGRYPFLSAFYNLIRGWRAGRKVASTGVNL